MGRLEIVVNPPLVALMKSQVASVMEKARQSLHLRVTYGSVRAWGRFPLCGKVLTFKSKRRLKCLLDKVNGDYAS